MSSPLRLVTVLMACLASRAQLIGNDSPDIDGLADWRTRSGPLTRGESGSAMRFSMCKDYEFIREHDCNGNSKTYVAAFQFKNFSCKNATLINENCWPAL